MDDSPRINPYRTDPAIARKGDRGRATVLAIAALEVAIAGALFLGAVDLTEADGRHCRWNGGPLVGAGLLAVAAALGFGALALARRTRGGAPFWVRWAPLPLAIAAAALIATGAANGCQF